MKEIVIASFYKFAQLQALTELRETILQTMHTMSIKGTIILANEGINGSFAGMRENMQSFYHFLRSYSQWSDLNFKETFDPNNPFDKAKVKLRKEIVTMGQDHVKIQDLTNTHLSPEQWHELIQDPEVIILDTRNDYEYLLGTFQNAINPTVDTFKEFPEYVSTHLNDKKNKKIAMFCTGGIRCEKTTAYMKSQGFNEVYQLKDGILNYIEKIPAAKSLWRGKCFVFDNRVAVDHNLERVLPQLPQDHKEGRFKKSGDA